ncbi:homoprotocatechuate degradation operon regulator HpaR [Leeia sp. TBRC 13508]|uniref:Homoprotocatechuate degradation operon regulator HpaR n=1 Tax=Leeia speluncae TaxID=2884804 RepID=A0ABS8D9V0_9NEIS|nr:homoprotocatechuate degradation operon regulator HpaR [Leeia speluncae]MCB6184954.1 homoprotocatechuate degradation operon regulator HpaR [Leeia speluncae]
MKKLHTSLTIALLRARETTMGFFRPLLNKHGLTEQQWRIMRVLLEKNTIEFQHLAELTCILRPSLTGILTRMERDGLVLKLKPTTDQRKIYVALTDTAREMVENMADEVAAAYQKLEEQLSVEKIDQLMALLEEVSQLQVPESEPLVEDEA